MLILFMLILGMTAMLGCWGLAWWLLKQPVAGTSIEPRPPQSAWRNEPTLGQGPSPPASENPTHAPIPSPRTHENSDSNTQFYSRSSVHRRAEIAEETEILHDQPATRNAILEAPPPAPPRKTQWFAGPGTSANE